MLAPCKFSKENMKFSSDCFVGSGTFFGSAVRVGLPWVRVWCVAMSLKGLAEALNKNEAIRSTILHKGTILQWPSPRLVGVHTFNTMASNEAVMMEVLKIWLPQNPVPKTICIDDCREEVHVENKKC